MKVYLVYRRVIMEDGGVSQTIVGVFSDKKDALDDSVERQQDIDVMLECELHFKNGGTSLPSGVVGGAYLGACGIAQIVHAVVETDVLTNRKLVVV